MDDWILSVLLASSIFTVLVRLADLEIIIGDIIVYYACVASKKKIQTGADAYQRISGAVIDKAVGELLVEMVTPLAMASVLQVQNEPIARDKEIDDVRRKDVERCRMKVSRTRYLNTDPANTLVTKHLESDWNDKIRTYEQRLDSYQKERKENLDTVDERTSAQIMAVADNFKALWENPQVQNEERKRMLRLLVDNVLITQFDEHIHLAVNFKSSTCKEFDIQKGKQSYESWRTPPEALEVIKSGLDRFLSNTEIADELNAKGLKSGRNLEFTRSMVTCIIGHREWKTVKDRYRLKTKSFRKRIKIGRAFVYSTKVASSSFQKESNSVQTPRLAH